MPVSKVGNNIPIIKDWKACQEPERKRYVGGAVVGGALYYGIKNSISKYGAKIYGNTFLEQYANNNYFKEAVLKAFDNSKLKEIVELVNAKDVSEIEKIMGISKSAEIINSSIPKSQKQFLFTSYIKKFINQSRQRKTIKLLKANIQQTVNGTNAFYLYSLKNSLNQKIFVNLDKLSEGVFHEMGHAINRNFSKIGSALQKIRQPAIKLCALALASALFINKKEKEKQPSNFIDRVGMFLKNNCGAIAAIGYLPTIAEEALATYNGNKIAKQFLSADKLKILKVHNVKALLTYAATGIGITAGVIAASKVRDIIAKPKEA